MTEEIDNFITEMFAGDTLVTPTNDQTEAAEVWNAVAVEETKQRQLKRTKPPVVRKNQKYDSYPIIIIITCSTTYYTTTSNNMAITITNM